MSRLSASLAVPYHPPMGRDTQRETPVSWFHTRATHYVEAQMLFHLSQVGVIAELHRAPATAEELAARLQLGVHVLRTMLDYVVGVDDLLQTDERGRYVVTEFGDQVFRRFAKNELMEEFNFFDVRVGCYGPVWHHLGAMLTGAARYGEDFHRVGQHAAEGVSKLSRHMIKPIDESVARTGCRHLAVIGVTPGLIEAIAEHQPGLSLYGLDRDQAALDELGAALDGKPSVRLLQGDFFKPETWARELFGADQPATGLLVSIHFHEFMARGIDAMKALMGALKQQFPGWHVLALEQDRLPESAREDTPETLWLYAHSNILIHHLIGNGKILTREEWLDVLGSGGAAVEAVINAEYLGYHGYLVAL